MGWLGPPYRAGYLAEGTVQPVTFSAGLAAIAAFLDPAQIDINAMMYGASGCSRTPLP